MIRTGILPEERIAASFWTTAEERTLRAAYPQGGVNACLPLLPRRSKQAIRQRAYKLRQSLQSGGQQV